MSSATIKNMRLIWALLIASAAASGQVVSRTLPKIARLKPRAFPELPANLLRELNRRSCRIPQVRPYNVRECRIRGEFAGPGQTDWAVLCSKGSVTTLLVFWNGSERNPAVVMTSGYPPYWSISAASPDRIKTEHQGLVVSSAADHTIFYYKSSTWQAIEHVVDRIY